MLSQFLSIKRSLESDIKSGPYCKLECYHVKSELGTSVASS